MGNDKDYKFYTASIAALDSINKSKESENFVDKAKIYLLTQAIKDQITNFKSMDSSEHRHLQKQHNYNNYLSKGEQDFLKNLGYKIVHISPSYDTEEYWQIFW